MARLALAAGLMLTPGACAEPPPARSEPPPGRIPASPVSPTPPTPQGVRVEADPPPPFTYWAPQGSVIRNHGNPGLWVAYVNGRQVKTYFGDDCGASRRQGLVGASVERLPPESAGWRVSAQDQPVTDDLRPGRTNVVYDPQTRLILEVACY